MKIKNIIKILTLSCVGALICACSSNNASYIDSGGAQSVTSVNKINMADWNNAAATLVNKLLASGKLDNYPQPVRMQVTRVVNATSQVVETELLTGQIEIALNSSGKVVVVSSDALSKELERHKAMTTGNSVAMPRIVMNGKIIEDRESVGSTREVTYIFMLNIDADGVKVWQEQVQIAKQKSRGVFGL